MRRRAECRDHVDTRGSRGDGLRIPNAVWFPSTSSAARTTDLAPLRPPGVVRPVVECLGVCGRPGLVLQRGRFVQQHIRLAAAMPRRIDAPPPRRDRRAGRAIPRSDLGPASYNGIRARAWSESY